MVLEEVCRLRSSPQSSGRSGALQKIRSVADYQFDRGAGLSLFPASVKIRFSPATGRVRHIYLRNKLLATLRPTDGFFGLTVEGGRRLLKAFKPPRFRVVVNDSVEEFIRTGSSVFAKHILMADPDIRPLEEVVVTNSRDETLAVGRALLTGCEMPLFKRGVAVKIRHSTPTDE